MPAEVRGERGPIELFGRPDLPSSLRAHGSSWTGPRLSCASCRSRRRTARPRSPPAHRVHGYDTSIRTRRCSVSRSRTAIAGSRCRSSKTLKPKARAAGLWNLFLPESEDRRRADQHRVRAALRDHGPVPGVCARGLQLLGAGHRQHGSARALRHARAAAAMARAAARAARSDPASR